MHMDKKGMRKAFLFVAGSILFAWLVLDTARASALLTGIWDATARIAWIIRFSDMQ